MLDCAPVHTAGGLGVKTARKKYHNTRPLFFFHFQILLSLRFFFKTCLKKRVLILNTAKFPNGKIILY